jgi:hypothetical protein
LRNTLLRARFMYILCSRILTRFEMVTESNLPSDFMSYCVLLSNHSPKVCNRPCRTSDCQSPASQCGGPGLSPGQIRWDLWWTRRHRGRFSPSTSAFHANRFCLWESYSVLCARLHRAVSMARQKESPCLMRLLAQVGNFSPGCIRSTRKIFIAIRPEDINYGSDIVT